MIKESEVIRLVENHLKDSDVFLVDVAVKPRNVISVFIDGDHGVSIEACRRLNHFLNENLDREKEDFELTVSSPGAGRPLKLPRQFRKNIGRRLDVITVSGDNISGLVTKADGSGIEMETDSTGKRGRERELKVVALKFSEIKSAREVIMFKQ